MTRKKLQNRTTCPKTMMLWGVGLLMPFLLTLCLVGKHSVLAPIFAPFMPLGLMLLVIGAFRSRRQQEPPFDLETIGDLRLGGTFLVSLALPTKRAVQVEKVTVRVVFRETAYLDTEEVKQFETEISRQILPGGTFRPGDVLRGEAGTTLPETWPALQYAKWRGVSRHIHGFYVTVEVARRGRGALKETFALDVSEPVKPVVSLPSLIVAARPATETERVVSVGRVQ